MYSYVYSSARAWYTVITFERYSKLHAVVGGNSFPNSSCLSTCLTYLVHSELLPTQEVIEEVFEATWVDVEENVCSFVH